MYRLIKWLINGIVCLVFLCLAVLLVQGWLEKDNPRYVPGLGRYKLISVLSDSMKPMMKAGDAILVDSQPKGELREGAVVTYWRSGNGSLLTHRIVAAEDYQGGKVYYTRGDANNVMDGTPVAEKDIVGKYLMCIPGGGNFISYLHTKPGFIFLILAPILIGLLLEVRKLYPEVYAYLLISRKQSAEVKQTEA